jgi:hypothetical protein
MKIEQINSLSNDEYHKGEKYIDYWSSSNLKHYLRTPREAIFQKYHAEKKQSDALDFGTLLHDYLESKHVTGKPFDYKVFTPPTNPKTGEAYGKSTKAYQSALSEIENPILEKDMKIIEDIWKMIKQSHYRWYFEKVILKNGIAEPSFFVEAGVHKYKYRADVLTDKVIFDYKTTTKTNWTIDKMNWVIRDYGYDISAAMYQYYEYERTGIWKPFHIIWIMKEPPYDILIQDISSFCYESFNGAEPIVNSGALTFQKLKEQHELCQVSNQWPGIANQFQKYAGIRIAETSPRFERGFDEFEID